MWVGLLENQLAIVKDDLKSATVALEQFRPTRNFNILNLNLSFFLSKWLSAAPTAPGTAKKKKKQ